MPAIRTRAASRQVAISTAERPSLTDTEADLDAEIEAELAILSQAADMLISESNTNLGSFIDPVYIRIRQQNRLDADIQSALLWSQEAVQSTESSTIAEPTGFEGVLNHEDPPHQLFFSASGLPSSMHGHRIPAPSLSAQSLGLITAQIQVLTAYLNPDPYSQLTPDSLATLYGSLSVDDVIRFCYFLREWGYETSVRLEFGAGTGAVGGRVVLHHITRDRQGEVWTFWDYTLVGQHPRYETDW